MMKSFYNGSKQRAEVSTQYLKDQESFFVFFFFFLPGNGSAKEVLRNWHEKQVNMIHLNYSVRYKYFLMIYLR